MFDDNGYSGFALKIMLIGTILIVGSVIVYFISKILTTNTISIDNNIYDITVGE